VQEEACVSVERAAQVVHHLLDPGDHIGLSDHGPAHDVRVSVQVLGTAVQREVEPNLRGPEVDRTGERVVDHRDQLVRPGESHHSLQVRHLYQRVGDRLDVDHPRFPPQLLGPRVGPVAGHEVACESMPGELPPRVVVRAPVQAVLEDHVIAGRKQRMENRGDRGHAAGGDHGGVGVLERGQLGAQNLVVGRVAQPHVLDVVILFALHRLEVGGLEYGQGHRALDPGPDLTGVDQPGVDRAFLLRHAKPSGSVLFSRAAG
jgi:hypothetical protein